MESKLADLYYCRECKRVVSSLSDLFFVEENSSNGFCSEGCIEKFYVKIVDYFDSYNKEVLNNLNIQEEHVENESRLLEEVLNRPKKVYQWSNQLGTEITHFLGEVDQKYVAVTGFLYEGSASFILGMLYHSDHRIWNFFEKGENKKIKYEYGEDVKGMSGEQLEYIEHKKAELLAKVLECYSEDDISFESYAFYEKYVSEVLAKPDFKKLIDSSSLGSIYVYSKVIFDGQEKIYFIVANLESENGNNIILYIPSLMTDMTSLFFDQDNFIKN